MGAGKAIAITFVILILVVIGAYLFFNPGILAKQQQVSHNVVVSGTVKTGFGTSPHNITFTSEQTGQRGSTTINKNGFYSIGLVGNDTYSVVVYYNTLFGVSTNNNCAGTLILNATVNSLSYSKSC